MTYVNKTLVVPAYAKNQTPIDQNTGMAQGFQMSPLLSLASAATKPIKNRQVQVSTPLEREHILSLRDKIGQPASELDNALKAREGFGYTLANALSGIPQQQGAGSWLSDFARAFGGAMASPTNAMVDRAEKKYQTAMKDFANSLLIDKAAGDKVVTDLGYMYPESNNNDMLTLLLLSGFNK